MSSFLKSTFQIFSSELKRTAYVFKFLRFDSFRKATFSWQIGVDGRNDRWNNAAFPKFSGVVWKVEKLFYKLLNKMMYPFI